MRGNFLSEFFVPPSCLGAIILLITLVAMEVIVLSLDYALRWKRCKGRHMNRILHTFKDVIVQSHT